MKVSADELDGIEDLNPNQVRGIKSILAACSQLMADSVVKCSIGRGDVQAERELITAKCQHEGALKMEQLFMQELQRIRKAAENRRPA